MYIQAHGKLGKPVNTRKTFYALLAWSLAVYTTYKTAVRRSGPQGFATKCLPVASMIRLLFLLLLLLFFIVVSYKILKTVPLIRGLSKAVPTVIVNKCLFRES